MCFFLSRGENYWEEKTPKMKSHPFHINFHSLDLIKNGEESIIRSGGERSFIEILCRNLMHWSPKQFLLSGLKFIGFSSRNLCPFFRQLKRVPFEIRTFIQRGQSGSKFRLNNTIHSGRKINGNRAQYNSK